MDYVHLDAAFTARAGASLSAAVGKVAGETWDEETFRAAVAANLANGRFRLVIAVDDITEELRRIVRFLNGHTTHELEILPLELRYVADSGIEILFPTTYGEKPLTSVPPQAWSEERFFSTIASSMSATGNEAARRLYDFARDRGAKLQWGIGPLASVTARMMIAGKALSALNLSEWPKENPKLFVHFEYLIGSVPHAVLVRFAQDIYQVSGWSVSQRELETSGYRKRPSALLDHLSSEEVVLIEAALDLLLSA